MSWKHDILNIYASQVEDIRNAGLFKGEAPFVSAQGPRVTMADGRQLLCMCANNYLGLGNNPRLIEAAEDLGCNSLQVFRLVTLPLSMPGILSGITMVFVPAVSTFYISQKLGGTDTVLIGDVIERQFKQGNNPNLGAALSLVLMLLVFVCTGIMNRFGADEEGGVIA